MIERSLQMPVIVRHKESGHKYILVGTGFGKHLSVKESEMFRSPQITGDTDELKMVAVCEDSGDIRWVNSEEIRVVEIDGHTPAELLNQQSG
jgi:hypothetical protein